MGMTDRQFDAYNSLLLIGLRRALKASKENGFENEALEEIIKDLENQLERP